MSCTNEYASCKIKEVLESYLSIFKNPSIVQTIFNVTHLRERNVLARKHRMEMSDLKIGFKRKFRTF